LPFPSPTLPLHKASLDISWLHPFCPAGPQLPPSGKWAYQTPPDRAGMKIPFRTIISISECRHGLSHVWGRFGTESDPSSSSPSPLTLAPLSSALILGLRLVRTTANPLTGLPASALGPRGRGLILSLSLSLKASDGSPLKSESGSQFKGPQRRFPKCVPGAAAAVGNLLERATSWPYLRPKGQKWRVAPRSLHFHKLPGDCGTHWGLRTTGLRGPTGCGYLQPPISSPASSPSRLDSTPALHTGSSLCLECSFP